MQEQIREKENCIALVLKEAIDEHLRKGECYYCIEENKSYYPEWKFYDDPLHPGTLRYRGVSLFGNKIEVSCYPARKDGSRALIGNKMIDITKLVY